jgi:hypothetical protein
MKGRARSILLLAAALAAVAIGVAALLQGGDDGTSGVRPEAVAEAAERTARVHGLRYTMTGETEIPQVGKSFRFTGEGVSDVRGQRGTAHMDMSQMAELAKQEGQSGPMTDADTWQMDMVFDRRFFYMKFPLASAGLGGKEWAKFDILKVSEALGIDPVLARAQQQQGDPVMSLQYMRSVSDDVEQIGTETIRGVETTHYRATIDLRKYVDLVPREKREEAERSVDRLIELSGGEETADMEVWVGKDKLVHRLKQEQNLKLPGQNQVSRGAFTTDFVDHDAKVRITPPDKDEVRDITAQSIAQLRAQRETP